jgi:hypothetical protein
MLASMSKIIETSANQLYAVRDHASADLAHVWIGLPVKRAKGGYLPKAGARETLVRKEASRVVCALVSA